VQIATLGGSFTDGMDCNQKLSNGHRAHERPCSWTSRFLYWLERTFPKAKVSVQNWNRGGTASCPHLVMLPLLLNNILRSSALDLIILDTLVNGNFEAYQDSYCYEEIIRTLHAITPNTAIFSLLAGPPLHFRESKERLDNLRAEEAIDYHYGVPVVNLGKLVIAKPTLWQVPQGNALVHPDWETHQLTADLVSSFFGRVWAARCTNPSRPLVTATWPAKTYYPEEKLAKYRACTKPVSSYSAFDATGWDGSNSNAKPTVLNGNWTRYEDKPRKPGWISTQSRSRISFKVTFGSKPNLLIVYLMSYAGLGNAFLRVVLPEPYKGHPEHQATLAGRWDQKVSQAAIYRVVEGFQPLFFLPPHGTADVIFELQGSKFKILGVYSC